jgi:SAM-dependent methyltransferase
MKKEWMRMEIFDSRIHQTDIKFLNLGCGTHYHNDWINVDLNPMSSSIIQYNFLQGIPFSDNFCDVVYSSHFLEHIPRDIGQRFLDECYRVLKPGGICRIVTPDLELMAKNYLTCLSLIQTNKETNRLDYEESVLKIFDQAVRNFPGGEYLGIRQKRRELNIITNPVNKDPGKDDPGIIRKIAYYTLNELKKVNLLNLKQLILSKILTNEEYSYFQIGKFRLSGEIHYFIYDSYSLTALMQKSNFKRVIKQTAHESLIPNFENYYLDTLKDNSTYKTDSLYLEGIK